MDQILNIFKSLGVDGTVLHQFVVFTIIFIILHNLLFKKLQFVIQTREEKTTKLVDNAEENFIKAEELASQYKEKIEEAHQKASEILNKRKGEIVKAATAKMKQEQSAVDSEYEKNKNEFLSELDSKKIDVLKQSSDLSKELVNKLV